VNKNKPFVHSWQTVGAAM